MNKTSTMLSSQITEMSELVDQVSFSIEKRRAKELSRTSSNVVLTPGDLFVDKSLSSKAEYDSRNDYVDIYEVEKICVFTGFTMIKPAEKSIFRLCHNTPAIYLGRISEKVARFTWGNFTVKLGLMLVPSAQVYIVSETTLVYVASQCDVGIFNF